MTTLHSDQPIKTTDQDELQIGSFVDRLQRPLLEWPPDESLVVGLYAPWGTGKTSVLNLLQERLERPDTKERAVVARFNPWLYQDAEALLQAFFATLREVTRTTPLLTAKARASLGTALDSIGKMVVPVSAALARTATGGVDLVTPTATAVAHGVKAALKGGEVKLEAEKRKAAKTLEKMGKQGKRARLVVLIDDLDRSETREVRAMLKLVRLIADLPNVTYVLAMDYERVRRILSEPGDETAGASYLEKIVQIAIPLPPIPPSRIQELLVEAIDSTLNEASAAGQAAGIEPRLKARRVELDEVVLWRLRTLRDRARLVNSFRFLLLSGSQALEVDAVDAVLVAFLQTFYPAILERIRRNKEFLTLQYTTRGIMRRMATKDDAWKKERKSSFDLIIKGETGGSDIREAGDDEVELSHEVGGVAARLQEQTRLRTLVLKMFPYAENGEEPNAPKSRKWRRQNRIAAPERFDRYFTFSPPEDSARDDEVTDWIDASIPRLRSVPALDAHEEWREFATRVLSPLKSYSQGKRSDFVAKLLDRIEEIDLGAFVPLAFVIAHAPGAQQLRDTDAADAIRQLLQIVKFRRQRAEVDALEDKARLAEAEETVRIARGLHEAFAALVRTVTDPFDAVGGAGEHVNSWRKEAQSAQRAESVKDEPLSDELRHVLDAGLAQIDAARMAGRDIFTEHPGRAGQPIWRWRDLLRHIGASYDPIRVYLGDILAAAPERLPAVLGLFAGWSDDGPSFRMMSVAHVRKGAEEIVGWTNLLRAVIRYHRTDHGRDPIHDHLVQQFERKVRSGRLERSSRTLEDDEDTQ